MVIQQGDQYALPVKIKIGNDIITPQNCTDVRIKCNELLLEYSKGEISYNDTEKTWCFPITENLSLNYQYELKVQIGVKFDEDFVYSQVMKINVLNSIIKEKWNV